MVKRLRTQQVEGKVFVEFLVVKDKERRITVPRLTEYYVQIHFTCPGRHVILRGDVFTDETIARNHYDSIRRALGQ